MRDRRIALNVVGTGPEKEVARPEFIEFEGIQLPAENGAEIPRFAHPDILFARAPRHVLDAIFAQDEVNEAGTIHPAVRRIGRTVFVVEILLRQVERIGQQFAYGLRIFVEVFDLIRCDRRDPNRRRGGRRWTG